MKKIKLAIGSILCSGFLLGGLLFSNSFMVAAEPTSPPSARAPLGWDAKIRLGWMQWHLYNDNTVPQAGTDLLDALANVGVNVFADWRPHPDKGAHAHQLGIRYYRVGATADLRGPAASNQVRLAVDKYGLTCLEQFDKYVAEGGDPNKPWGFYGEGGGAYIPCPLEPLPWYEAFFKQALVAVQEGWLDGLSFDAEPYGAYRFDHPTEMLCYCDHCFSLYRDKHASVPELTREERFNWLEEKRLVTEYLTLLREHRIAMFRELAAPIWAVNPQFGFAMYPDFKVSEIEADWGHQGIAYGLHTKASPFLVVDSTPYWEDHRRPFWEQRHDAYRKAGFKHVLGSWDAMMANYPYMDVGAEQANYEFAMNSDGFWRWGERVFNPMDWRMFASVNQRVRQKETKLGDYLLRGEVVYNFVTCVEETGATWLERAIVAQTFKRGDRYLIQLNNGNVDFPIELRVRLPRLSGLSGTWRLVDPIYDMVWIQSDGTATWDGSALRRGVTVVLKERGEQYLLVEPVEPDYRPELGRTIKSFEVKVHLPRPDATQMLPKPVAALNEHQVLFTRTYNHGSYSGVTNGGGLLTKLGTVDLKTGSSRDMFGFPGYLREPSLSSDRTRIAAAGWNNGKSQIYLINALNDKKEVGGPVRNVSNNDFCDCSPIFSPDATRLAFVSDRDGDWNIYSMSLDGSDLRRLTDSPATDKQPAWSPDGQRLAFVSNRDGNEYDVFVMNADGSSQTRLLSRDGNEYEPTWSPDGRKIAFTVQRRWNRCIQICNPDGSDPYYIGLGNVTHLHSISWSPDGQKLAGAFSHLGNAGVVIMDQDGKVLIGEEDWNGERLKKLVDVPPTRTIHGGWHHTGSGSPREVAHVFSGVNFSADGQTLIYCSNQPPIISTARSFERLTKLTEVKESEIVKLEPEKQKDRDPRREAAQALADEARAVNSFQLYTIDVQGGEPHRVPGTNTDWPAVTIWR